jgi:hypothetical protein
VSSTTPEERPAPTLTDRIGEVGRDLRRVLAPAIEDVGGVPPRPTRLTRAIGLDKSLASRFVRAVRADSDPEFLHLVPSPTGLRIFSERARGTVADERLHELDAATERFQEFLDSTPGGRDAIDANISESSREVREKREHVAKQASFKSMSYLLGHYCETLATSLFLVPAANGRTVDAIEIHHRLGIERMRPSTPLALLSVFTPPEGEPPDDSTWVESLANGLGATSPMDYLLTDFSSQPLPPADVLVEDSVMTLVLAGDPALRAPRELTSAFRIRNGWSREPDTAELAVRGYVLHMPCRSLVRDIFLAEEVYPGAVPQVSFQVPKPGEARKVRTDDGSPHYSTVELTSRLEQLPSGPRGYEVTGAPSHGDAVMHALERGGHGATRFHGWRCAMSYPVSLLEMIWWLDLPERGV